MHRSNTTEVLDSLFSRAREFGLVKKYDSSESKYDFLEFSPYKITKSPSGTIELSLIADGSRDLAVAIDQISQTLEEEIQARTYRFPDDYRIGDVNVGGIDVVYNYKYWYSPTDIVNNFKIFQ